MKRRLGPLLVLAALSGGAACREKQSVVVVTTNIAGGVPELHQLRVHLHLESGDTDDLLFPPQPKAAPIPSRSKLAVTLSTSRSGTLDVTVYGLVAGTPVASGSNQTTIQVGGRADVTVDIVLCKVPGCEAPPLPDGGAGGAGGSGGGGAGGGTDGGAGGSGGTPADGGGDGQPQVTLSTGLVARWKMDDGATNPLSDVVMDSSGMGNHGSVPSSPDTWVKDVYPGARYPNPGAFFAGGVYVMVGTNGYPAFEAPKSLALWIKPLGTSVTTEEILAITDEFEQPNGSQLLFHFINDSGAPSGRSLVVLKKNNSPILSAPFPASGWHHVAYTFDGSLHRLYLDGQEVRTSTAVPDTGRPAFSQLAGQTFVDLQATMDEVRLYARTLSAAEVLKLDQGYE
jgi:Concanavalin A-like lectin/glucanases superfamily